VEKGVYINKPAELISRRSNELSAVLTWRVSQRCDKGLIDETSHLLEVK